MKTYHKSIIFTKTPLTRHYRYQDIFQIYPADLYQMPKSKFQKHYPVIIEYWTTENEIIKRPEDLIFTDEFEKFGENYSLLATQIVKQDKIINLLTAFTNHNFFKYNGLSGIWGINAPDKATSEEYNNLSSEWSIKIFHWPEQPKQLKIEKFSELEFNEISKIPHKTYFYHDPNLDSNPCKSITFPDSIDLVLGSYFSKDADIQTKIDAAISYSVSAVELLDKRKTLSLLASFTSMETMVNIEFQDFKPQICEACGQQQYKIAKKYRDFFFKYIGESLYNKKKFNSYYSLRSKIVHTGTLLKTENIFTDVSRDEKNTELITRLEILQLGKLAIIQWLIEN